MTDVNVLDTKHSGVTLMRLAFFTERGSLEWRGGLLAGQSGDDVCAACTTLSDPGCHKKLSRQSYNQATPFTPAVGLQSAMFALQFTVGPEKKPWDKPMGYSVVHVSTAVPTPDGLQGTQRGLWGLGSIVDLRCDCC